MGVAERVQVLDGRGDGGQDGGSVERDGGHGIAQGAAER
jgi:hypothetical protein